MCICEDENMVVNFFFQNIPRNRGFIVIVIDDCFQKARVYNRSGLWRKYYCQVYTSLFKSFFIIRSPLKCEEIPSRLGRSALYRIRLPINTCHAFVTGCRPLN